MVVKTTHLPLSNSVFYFRRHYLLRYYSLVVSFVPHCKCYGKPLSIHTFLSSYLVTLRSSFFVWSHNLPWTSLCNCIREIPLPNFSTYTNSFVWCMGFWVKPYKFRKDTSIMAAPLPSKSFINRYPPITLKLNSVTSETKCCKTSY